jgi:hypothetical protein
MISFTNITASLVAMGWQHNDIQQTTGSGVIDGGQKMPMVGLLAAPSALFDARETPYVR